MSRSVEAAFVPLLVEPADRSGGLSRHLETRGEVWQLREYAALRSLYHLKEADRLHRALRGALVGNFACAGGLVLEDRLAHHIRESRDHGRSALRGSLPAWAWA
ncbi:hypothetical protein ACWGAN_22950 [Streptomyces sp. NPDC054945]